MELRHETVTMNIKKPYRLLHIADVHFSAKSSHEKSLRMIGEILALAESAHCAVQGKPDSGKRLDAVCITGDLVSRKCSPEGLDDALLLLQKLQELLKEGEIFYSLGNHEMDLPEDVRKDFFHSVREMGVHLLDNQSRSVYFAEDDDIAGICFTGLTLPQSVYKNEKGGYWNLSTITRKMLKNCVGSCAYHPCVLLAHTPLGFPAYVKWGADLVLSGHIHGGVVRVKNTGLLSPERRFLPKYTKGLWKENKTVMIVSAGIGKFRVNNPAEIVCIDLIPEKEEAVT